MSNVRICLEIFFATVGVVFGISGCITFYIYQNIVAGTWAFFSGLFAAICLHLHYLKFKNHIHLYHSPLALSNLAGLGLVVGFISTAFLFWYLFGFIYWKKAIFPIKESYVIMAVWSFMTAKWGLYLYYISKKYEELISYEFPTLINTR